MKVCCGFTGHRIIPQDKREFVEYEIWQEVIWAADDGYTRFISGFAEGADLIFAKIVAELKAQHPAITLEAAIPYHDRLENRNGNISKPAEKMRQRSR